MIFFVIFLFAKDLLHFSSKAKLLAIQGNELVWYYCTSLAVSGP